MNSPYLVYVLYLMLGAGLLAFRPSPPISAPAFQSGEFLKYRIHYGFVTAGYATLEVMPEQAILQDRACWHIVGKGFTHPGFDWVYKVRDQYETFVDTESLLSRRFNRHIRKAASKAIPRHILIRSSTLLPISTNGNRSPNTRFRPAYRM